MKKTLTLAKTEEQTAHMILVEGRGEPKYVHCSLEEARNEAKRLAAKEPNRLIKILQVVQQIRCEPNPEIVIVPIVLPTRDKPKF